MIKHLLSIIALLFGWFGLNSQLWAPTAPVPEIDATSALTGLAVLAGVLAVVAEHRRQKR